MSIIFCILSGLQKVLLGLLIASVVLLCRDGDKWLHLNKLVRQQMERIKWLNYDLVVGGERITFDVTKDAPNWFWFMTETKPYSGSFVL